MGKKIITNSVLYFSILSDGGSIIKSVLCLLLRLFSSFSVCSRVFAETVYESFDPSDEKQVGVTKLERRMPTLTANRRYRVE